MAITDARSASRRIRAKSSSAATGTKRTIPRVCVYGRRNISDVRRTVPPYLIAISFTRIVRWKEIRVAPHWQLYSQAIRQLRRDGPFPAFAPKAAPSTDIDYEQIVVSFWLITCALAIAPAITGVRLVARVARRRHRRRHGQCLHCGFDLRASKDRCPECGHPVPAKPQPLATAPARTDTLAL